MEDKLNYWVLIVVGLCVMVGIVFLFSSCVTKANSLNRGDYLKQIAEIDKRYMKNPNDKKLKLEYAIKLFEIGEFAKSQELLKSFLDSGNPLADAVYYSAYIEYLNGHYIQAEKLGESLIDRVAPDEIKMKAQLGLLFIYYQTGQYEKTLNLFKGLEGKIQLALWDIMKAFGDKKPYQIEWRGKNRTIIPFVVTDPLPVISVKINGRQINVIIDTGGELFYLDESIASSLGINSTARQVEPYAGGKTIEVGYGRADSLTIGDVTLKSVPIKLGPIQRISSIFDNKTVISGILTTGILQQFLATMDYPGSRLILRPRNEFSRSGLRSEFVEDKKITELPFVLALTHLMICKGSINGRDALNLFVDSGLADSEAALCLPKETLDYLGIPIPVTEILPGNLGGLAGGGFPVGRFTVDKLSMGSLQQDNVVGLYGVFPPQLYHECDFLIDGLISHRFLKNYKWTIDFDSMKMIFSQ